jgi:hypothetical protein
MLEELSSREVDDLQRALREGSSWARVLAACFVEDGRRLVLGIGSARSEAEVARRSGLPGTEVRRALAEAARWCHRRGLHLLGYPEGEPAVEWRHFLAVG